MTLMKRSAPIAILSLAMVAAVRAQDVVESVVITATRTERNLLDVPASVASQSFEDLRELGFIYGSEEFRGVPGIFVRRGEGDGDEFLFVSIRGSSGTEGYLALIDGVPFLGPDEEPLLNQVPYDALERVEIVKGPVSALYGRGGLYGGCVVLGTHCRRATGGRIRRCRRCVCRTPGTHLSLRFPGSESHTQRGNRRRVRGRLDARARQAPRRGDAAGDRSDDLVHRPGTGERHHAFRKPGRRAQRARQIAVVLTERPSSPGLTVEDVICLGRQPFTDWRGQLTEDDERIAHAALNDAGAIVFRNRLLDDLSDGERQRVMIARALAQTSRLMVLDEITAFLDLLGRVEIMSLLRRWARETGAAILLSSHDLELSLQLADAVWLLTESGALEEGSPETLIGNGAIGRAFNTAAVTFSAAKRRFQFSDLPEG